MPEPESAPQKASLTAIVAVLATLLLTLAPRLYHLTTYGLWMDEVFSLRIARASWTGLLQQAAADAVHPPLFYIILKFWILVGGESLLWLKILPLVFGLLSVAVIPLVVRELGALRRVSFLICILISLNAYFIYYAQELRMYSLLMFMSLLSICAFVRFVKGGDKSRRSAAILFGVNLLLIYTHYFGLLTVATEGLALLILYREKWKPFLLQGLGLIACFLPWAIAVAFTISARGKVESNVAWIGRPPLVAVPAFLAELHGNWWGVHSTIAIGCLLFLAPLAVWIWQSWRDEETRRIAILLGSLAAVPIGLAFILSQITANSIWVERYMIAAGVPYLLLLVIAASRVRLRALSIICVTLMIAWALGAGIWDLYERQDRVDWNGFANTISSSEVAPVYTLESWAQMPLVEMLSRTGSGSVVMSVKHLDEIDQKQFWFLYRSSTWHEGATPEQLLQRQGCRTEVSDIDHAAIDEVHLILANCPATAP
jgi:mannosyltransferase